MYKTVSYESLKGFVIQIFLRYGFSGEEGEKIADVILMADLFGVESHGISRILKYCNMLDKGIISPVTKPVWLKETESFGLLDANGSMGQLAGIEAMEACIRKAQKYGMAMVEVRNSNHYGIAGYYALMAARKGLLGISMTNTVAILVPTFSAEALLGSNPIALAMPAGKDRDPFLFDASTTVVTRGKIELYKKLGKTLPSGWAVNAQGEACRDAGEVLACIQEKKGGLLPLGGEGEGLSGHKGYGFALICEIFTSILAGGVSSIPDCWGPFYCWGVIPFPENSLHPMKCR